MGKAGLVSALTAGLTNGITYSTTNGIGFNAGASVTGVTDPIGSPRSGSAVQDDFAACTACQTAIFRWSCFPLRSNG
ncbi:hypothetical protein C0Z20_30835 [Trinickia symbiotica]|uniref:Uncharacterized protein n=3 Tax=Trinickia symbiotica TaxID=863227 RepID=A0A2N7WJA3_9BURK|nr:hypothetical protein C0Z20_30835 [Trinickia symbiotica]